MEREVHVPENAVAFLSQFATQRRINPPKYEQVSEQGSSLIFHLKIEMYDVKIE